MGFRGLSYFLYTGTNLNVTLVSIPDGVSRCLWLLGVDVAEQLGLPAPQAAAGNHAGSVSRLLLHPRQGFEASPTRLSHGIAIRNPCFHPRWGFEASPYLTKPNAEVACLMFPSPMGFRGLRIPSIHPPAQSGSGPLYAAVGHTFRIVRAST